MQATIKTSPNIAINKYWGKKGEKNNLTDVSSISNTVDDHLTENKNTFGSFGSVKAHMLTANVQIFFFNIF